MIAVKLYIFSKKDNSTAAPSDSTQSITVDCVLKDRCSVISPVLIISESAVSNIYNYNYARLQQFNRYYYIDDIIYNNGTWELSLSVDVLASFKESIAGYNAYVLRSSYKSDNTVIFNGDIVDTKYPITAEQATFSATSAQNPLTVPDDDAGTWMIGIINKDSNGGAVTYYAMTLAGFRAFNEYIFNNVSWMNIDVTEISANLQRALINPYQFVVSCMWFPVVASTIQAPTQTIKMGWWNTGIIAKALNNVSGFSRTTSLNIPRHPQSTRGNYLNLSPYSTYTLRYFPFGSITIDSQAISKYNTLDLYVDVDFATGKGILNVAVNGKANPIVHIQAQVGVQIPTAAMMTDYSQMSTGTVVGASLLAGGQSNFFTDLTSSRSWDDVKGAFSNLWNNRGSAAKQGSANIASAAQAMLSSVDTRGEQGCITALFNQNLTLSGRFAKVAEEDFEHQGRPLCQNKVIRTLKGYILCADGDIAVNCSAPEKAAISGYLTGGFFYE